MTIKVGINGFGRIGRFVLRASYEEQHKRHAENRMPFFFCGQTCLF